MCKDRNLNYDLLRIMSCLAVITMHVTGTWMNNGNLPNTPITVALFDTVSQFCVPCFVMLSGAFNVSNDSNIEFVSFYKKTWIKVWKPMLVYSGVYICYDLLLWLAKKKSILDVVWGGVRGRPFYHMWYLYMMIGVYLLTPFVIWFKQQVTNEIFIKVSILFLIISGICRNVTLGGVREILDWDVGQSFEYLAYYMVGYSLRISVKKKSSLKGLIWIAGGIAILCASAYIVYGQMIGKFENVSVTNPWAPTVMIASYAIFKGVSLMETDLNVSDKIKSIILKVSSMTYSIYLIHGLVWELIQKILKVLKCDLTEVYTLIGIPVFTLFVFLISWFWSDIISCLKIKR